MRPLNLLELDLVIEDLQSLVGSQLQKVVATPKELGLCLYGHGSTKWLWIDLRMPPVTLNIGEDPAVKSKKVTPLLLFIKAHGVGSRLNSVFRDRELGRVIKLSFLDLEIEVRLFPGGQNIIAHTKEKSLSWGPVREIEPGHHGMKPEETIRSLDEILSQWRSKNPLKKSPQSKEDKQKIFKKKTQKAIERVEVDLEEKKSLQWQEAGDWLLAHQTIEVPEEWQSYVDEKLSLTKNIQLCFNKAKEVKEKVKRTELRLGELRDQLEKGQGPLYQREVGGKSLLEMAQVKGRRQSLAEGVDAFIGKSARENLALLRKAKPWDLWLHLRDFPGCYAIVRRPKGREVSEENLQKVSQWVVRQSKGAKHVVDQGEAFDVIVTECRFVRPIKGDKVGRVTYRNERTFVCRM